jgi:hypothetical protein
LFHISLKKFERAHKIEPPIPFPMLRDEDALGPPVDYLSQLLSAEDQSAHRDLAVRFRAFIQAHKHSGLSDFVDQLQSIHQFICRSPVGQSVRAMACGVFFGPRFILVNTNRLKELVSRSKSGMNNCFQRLGYDVMRPSNEIIALFGQLLPNLDPRAFQTKQWCLRIETEISKKTFPSHIPPEIADSFETERIPRVHDVKPPESKDISPLDVRFLLNRAPPGGEKKAGS